MNKYEFWMKILFLNLGFFITIAFVSEKTYSDKLATIDNLTYEITSLTSKIMAYEQVETDIKSYSYINPIHHEDYVKITSPFGLRNIPSGIYTGGTSTREHLGIDLIGVYHSRVVSVSDGIVIEHWLPPGYHKGKYYEGHPIFGGFIIVLNDDGTEAWYGHMSETYIKEYQRVEQGQVIGRTGNTGLSDGEHLHFQLMIEGLPVQPLQYIDIH